VSTPHDAVLAELLSQKPGQGADPPGVVSEAVSQKDEAETNHHRAQSPGRTPLHDPFAGSLIGLSVQDDGDDTHNDRANFEARKEDLWSHMANIREIQTQLANMHVAMENIGLGHQADQFSVERMHSTVPSEGEKWEDAVEGEDDEAKEKDAREQEFTKLANKFHGRKEATENMMTKVLDIYCDSIRVHSLSYRQLDELSRVVTAFHALRTPVVNLYGSRSNRKGKELLTGESGAQGLEPPLIVIPPPAEMGEPQTFLQGPVGVRVGNLGEKDGSGVCLFSGGDSAWEGGGG
jgi:hypothetical protein